MSDTIITVPPALAHFVNSSPSRAVAGLSRVLGGEEGRITVSADPAGQRLGSGGGAVHALHQLWSAGKRTKAVSEWVRAQPRVVLHAGGESRRLPAYAAIGKAFLPLPGIVSEQAEIHDQVLADVQLPGFEQVMQESGSMASVLIASGDVWLDFDSTAIPPATTDIVGFAMEVTAEVAQHFGVFLVLKDGRSDPGPRVIERFLQKPSVRELQGYGAKYDFLVDTGMWTLSSKAVDVLFRRCGWDASKGEFDTPSRAPLPLDLYTEVGMAVGRVATVSKALVRAGFRHLTASVVPLRNGRFYHLGSTRQLLESLEQLQWNAPRKTRSFRIASSAPFAGDDVGGSSSWVEGCQGKTPIELAGHNVVTGLPEAARLSRLEQGICVDTPPVDARLFVLRVYHIDDTLRGDASTGLICGQPASRWLAARGWAENERDVFNCRIYPVLEASEITDEAVAWFFAENPDPILTRRFSAALRLSAAQIPERLNFERYYRVRRAAHAAALRSSFEACMERGDARIYRSDFLALAEFCQADAKALGTWIVQNADSILNATTRPEHQSRFLMLLGRLSSGPKGKIDVQRAYQTLQSALVSSQQLGRVSPRLGLKDDQIVWARSPVRLDLAGGWTDTPPYCLERGGAVLNVAVLLNGQPPIQAFVRRIEKPVIQLRSIDQGTIETVRTFRNLAEFRNPRSNFSLPKAALALAGFLPQFSAGEPHSTLKAQMLAFGSGLEVTLLSAVPKGSGLGTSSILGATLLAALNRACGLGWDPLDLYNRVLGVEQLLTTGGGWQDQAGALFPGLKMIETKPGLTQSPTVRYLSEHALPAGTINRSLLLYYTGITRMAKGILQEIVDDMILGSVRTQKILSLIRQNARQAHHALQLRDLPTLQRAIGRSWRLNQQLDTGTSTPEIHRIIQTCGAGLVSCKLLGAGGGGYILLCAKDADAGDLIRKQLESSPPNSRARFIDFALSSTGVEATVS